MDGALQDADAQPVLTESEAIGKTADAAAHNENIDVAAAGCHDLSFLSDIDQA
jgi:hypothetical protein